MKWSNFLASAALLFAFAGPGRATIWCGRGAALDHPCKDSDARPLTKAAAEDQAHWMNLKGVWQVESATSAAGGGAEIQVMVDPPWAGCVRSQIPSSVDGIPLLIVPKDVPRVIVRGGGFFESVRRPPSRKSKDNLEDEKTYAGIVQRYGSQWLALPGVIGIAPGECDCGSCDFTEIEISVQRPFMSALLKKIPPSVDDVPITLLPCD
ncbi:MAG: hypothetical protein ACREQR_00435 [Candidatus Binataceae bacterium]